MSNRISYAMIALIAVITMGQAFGPTTYTPRLTVGQGTRAAAGALRVNGPATITGTLSTSGAALTNLDADELASGTVPDARLAANVPRETSGTTQIDFDRGCTTTPSINVAWVKIGSLVTLSIPSFSCTSDSTDSFADTTATFFLDASIRPTANLQMPINNMTDNGVFGIKGTIFVSSAGALILDQSVDWTASGSRGVTANQTGTYSIL